DNERRQHRGYLYDFGTGDDRSRAIADKTDSTLKCLEKRSERRAMDLPRQPQSDSLEIICAILSVMPRVHGDEINFWKRGSVRRGSHSQRYFRSLTVML